MGRFGILWLLTLSACGGLHDLTKDTARLTGKTAPGTVALLVGSAQEPIATAIADSGGSFRFDGLTPMTATLVLNDLAGHGALLTTTLLGGFETNTGAIALRPLESVAGILDLRSVGYEERVSTDRGDHLQPRYTQGAARVYTMRRLPGQTPVDIVETDSATGAARVLRAQESLGGYLGYDEATPALFDDHFYVYVTSRGIAEAGTTGNTWVALDVTSGEEVPFSLLSGTGYVRQPTDQGPYMMAPFHLAPGLFAYIARVGGTEPFLGDPTAPNAPVLELCGLALPAATRNCVRIAEHPARIATAGSVVTLAMQSSAYQIDLASEHALRVLAVPAGTTVADLYTSPAGLLLALNGYRGGRGDLQPTSILVKGDLGATNLLQVAEAPAGMSFQSVVASPDFARALVTLGGSGYTVNLAAPEPLAPVPTSAMVSGRSVAVKRYCSYDLVPGAQALPGELVSGGQCFAADGRLLAVLDPSAADCQALLGEGCPSYREILVALDPASGATSLLPLGGSATSSDGTRYAEIVRDSATTYLQVFLATGAATLDQATFLSAEHHDLAWSADGKVLFYFTRDPESGFEGLFRLDTATLETLAAERGSMVH
jgi:hypothetical protein